MEFTYKCCILHDNSFRQRRSFNYEHKVEKVALYTLMLLVCDKKVLLTLTFASTAANETNKIAAAAMTVSNTLECPRLLFQVARACG